MLPSLDLINEYLPESFVFFKPKDTVSGDFYWFSTLCENRVVLAAVDCTGHGVPGAMMSMKADALLTKVVKHTEINTSHEILQALHLGMVEELHQADGDNNDGMDLSLCIIDFKKNTIDFSGANNPLLIVRENGEMEYIRGDRNGIGGSQNLGAFFTSKMIKMERGMSFYLFTDGYQDQFGGEHAKKFMRKPFFELLTKHAAKPFSEQKKILGETLNAWMGVGEEGSSSQIDDILVIGFSV